MLAGGGGVLKPGGAYPATAQKPARLLWHEVDQAEDVRIRVNPQHLLQHPFGPGVDGKPVVDQGDLHAAQVSRTMSVSCLAHRSQVKSRARWYPRDLKLARRASLLMTSPMRRAMSAGSCGSQ